MSNNENLRQVITRLLADVYQKLIDIEIRVSELESMATEFPLGYSGLMIAELLTERFDVSELNELAYATANISPDQIPGLTRSERARAILRYCQRRGLVGALLAECQAARPGMIWPSSPVDEDQQAD